MTKARMREIRASAKKCGEGWMPVMEEMVIECLTEINRLQAFTRRGTNPDDPATFPKTAKPKNGATDPRIKEFIDGWHTAFLDRTKEKYKVQGVKDATAVKRLLTVGTVDQLLDIAWEAWKHPDKFNCKQAVTIIGFEQRFNDIRQELKTAANGGRPQRSEPAGCTL